MRSCGLTSSRVSSKHPHLRAELSVSEPSLTLRRPEAMHVTGTPAVSPLTHLCPL